MSKDIFKIAKKTFKSRLIIGTGKYKKMVGIKCPYGVQYHEDIVWYTHKCKLN